MTKHTPGPWETGQAAWNEDGDVMYTLHGIKIATVADCRLIGAAPDILEALIMVRDADDDCRQDGLPTIPAPARAKIDRAIAKAEGRE